MLESEFQARLIEELREMFPEAIILKNDANYLQGFPDITILYGDRWAVLETKRRKLSHRQTNQQYYVEHCDEMSFGRFIDQENKERVLDELQQAFGVSRSSRLPKSF